mgnify:CR=1 FL=1
MHIYKHIKHKNKLFALFIIFLLHCYNSYSYYWGEMDNKTDKKTNRRSEKMYVIVNRMGQHRTTGLWNFQNDRRS